MLRVSLVRFGKIHKSTRVVINRRMYSIFAEAQDECVLCQINGFDFTLPVGIKIATIGCDYVLYYTISTEDIIACLLEVRYNG